MVLGSINLAQLVSPSVALPAELVCKTNGNYQKKRIANIFLFSKLINREVKPVILNTIKPLNYKKCVMTVMGEISFHNCGYVELYTESKQEKINTMGNMASFPDCWD